MIKNVCLQFCQFFEFGADNFTKSDMQKDRVITQISSVAINANNNAPVWVKDIVKTQIYSKDGSVTTIENGYLDIGLIDTMKDLFVNFLGRWFLASSAFYAYKIEKNTNSPKDLSRKRSDLKVGFG